MKKQLMLLFTSFIFLISLISVSAGGDRTLSDVTVNITDGEDIFHNLTGNTSTVSWGGTYSYVLTRIEWTDSSANSSKDGNDVQNCNESIRLHYGEGNTNSVTSYTFANTTTDDSTAGSVGYSLDADQVFVEFYPHFNSTLSNCTYSGVAVSFTGGLLDGTLEALPQIGSDTGSFLQNLAPGVGAFILIMGVFGGVAGIIYAIVVVVRMRVGGNPK